MLHFQEQACHTMQLGMVAQATSLMSVLQLTIQGSIKASMTSIGKIDDPVQSHSSAPHLPASLISKLSLLPLETASDSTKPQPSPSLSNVADAPARRKKPLILELDTN